MRLLVLAILFFFLSCDRVAPPDHTVKIKTDQPEPRFSCDEEGEEDGPEVSIRSRLEFVDTGNMDNYKLKGYCSHSRRGVLITVNDFPLDEYPACKNKRWEVSLDLTTLTNDQKTKEIEFKVSQGEGSNVDCKKVKVSFSGCPKNYVPVRPLKDYYERAFCVMKYEAKLPNKSDSKAVSVPEEKPLTRGISYQTAVALCRNNGSHYDLMNNDQWQTIARHIEDTDENWSTGRTLRTTGNTLNCGIHSGPLKAASSDDEDSCSGSSYSCKEDSWSYFKRTHLLPTGHIIWDFCGNAGEIMKDKNNLSYSFKDHSYLLTGAAKDRFGPAKTYSASSKDRDLRRSHYWGLGVADLRRSGSLIIRGDQNRDAGIFSVNLDRDQEDSYLRGNIGFRCVYVP